MFLWNCFFLHKLTNSSKPYVSLFGLLNKQYNLFIFHQQITRQMLCEYFRQFGAVERAQIVSITLFSWKLPKSLL